MSEESLTIRSFRVVFDLERRIHRVDQWRIPVPYGVPLRGIAYWAAALITTVLFARVPVASQLTSIMPPPLRLVILPLAVAYLLARIEVDGRVAHSALASLVRFALAPSRLAGFRAVPHAGAVVRLADIVFSPDEHFARYRDAVIEGPAAVLLRYPALGRVKGKRLRSALHVRQLPGAPLFVGKHVRLAHGQRMVVHG